MVPINWLAVLAAVVIRMLVGGLWYSPLLFVKPWQALTGVTPETMRSGLGKAIALDLVMSLLMAVVLAEILGLAHIADWLNGALIGAWAWLGFVLATQLPLMTYENRPLKLVAINTGAILVSLLLMGALLGAWH
jgi:hypothetical protein